MSLNEELLELAESARKARDEIRQGGIKEKMVAVKRVCDKAKRAWSGSNIGYHARVYFNGILPPPAGAQFSPEWGLMSRLATNRPNPGWQVMGFQEVVDELVRRAGSPDIEAVQSQLSAFREEALSMKERAITLLTAAMQDGTDAVLARQLKHVEPLTVADSETIAPTLVPQSALSRDSGAMAQGLQLAPHQSLVALYLSAKILEDAFDTISTSTKEATLHMERIERQHRKMWATGKKVIVGHGHYKIWLELQNFLRDRLHLETGEFNSVSTAGISTKERLEEMLDEAAFAFVVMTPEDEQPDGKARARQNVVHEAGLFQGRLGFRKAIVLLEEPCEEFSNIVGLGQIRFPAGHLAAAFEEIRRVLEREGLVKAS